MPERTVRVVGPIPPPIHGAARVTDLVRRRLEQRPDVRVLVTDVDDTRGAARRASTLVRGLLGILLGRRGSVYVGGAGGELLWYHAVVVGLARLRRRPTVFHHHSYRYVDADVAAMRLLVRLGGPRLTHVVLDASMGEGLTRRYPAARRTLVCSNAGLLDPAPGSSSQARAAEELSGPLVLGHLSNLSLEKGLGIVVDLLTRLRADGTDVRLLLGGPSATTEAEAVVEQLQHDLPDVVEVLGPLDRDQVEDFHRRIDLFVFPSTYVHEAEPLVVLEAMRAGADTTAFGVGCLPALVPSDLLVARDADLPATVAPTLHGRSRPTAAQRADTARRFERRRTASLAAHEELVTILVEG